MPSLSKRILSLSLGRLTTRSLSFSLNNSLPGRVNNELHLSPRQVAEQRKANVSHYLPTCDLCQAADEGFVREQKHMKRIEGEERGEKPVHGVSLKNNLQGQLLRQSRPERHCCAFWKMRRKVGESYPQNCQSSLFSMLWIEPSWSNAEEWFKQSVFLSCVCSLSVPSSFLYQKMEQKYRCFSGKHGPLQRSCVVSKSEKVDVNSRQCSLSCLFFLKKKSITIGKRHLLSEHKFTLCSVHQNFFEIQEVHFL